MTITLTLEEAQELFDVVEAADKVLVTATKFGGNPKKGYVTILIKDYVEVSLNLLKQVNTIKTLRTRLAHPEDIYEEGCTPADFRVLREANARMAQELFELRSKK
jgi:hypothetical protein